MAAQCYQCGKPPMFVVQGEGDGQILLCLDCNLKFQQVTTMQRQHAERMINYLTDQMESMVGMRGLGPRFPETHVIQGGPVTLNNIKVSNSTIGVLNTGTIETVDSAVSTIRESGDAKLSAALLTLSQAVVSAQNVEADVKNKMMELLSMIATEATVPKEKRRAFAIRPLLQELAGLAGGAAALTDIYEKVRPLLEAAF